MNERQLRLSSRARGILITYGVAAFSWFFARQLPGASASGTLFGNPSSLIALGLAIQIALLIVGRASKTRERERGEEGAAYSQSTYVLELVADGATVLLFALGTFQAILASMPESL